jgi:hypothetical protein
MSAEVIFIRVVRIRLLLYSEGQIMARRSYPEEAEQANAHSACCSNSLA